MSDLLQANLDALRRTEPELADRIAAAEPAPLVWVASQAGPLCATLPHAGRALSLASRYDPAAEAQKLIAAVDWRKHACVVALGLGVGHHVTRLAEQLDDRTAMIVFEPNLALLRAVFEKIDHTAWLGKANVVVADGLMDRAGLLRRVEAFAGLLTQGTVLITHPACRLFEGDDLSAFGELVSDALAFCRTNVATSLVNSARTIRNCAMNVALYAAGATTDELHNAAAGAPAVCVGAGPSLAKNVDLLTDPAIRRRVIVITAQTTLKPLLDRGIRPDIVTALDYHEISRRFYEHLPDLPDVTLVAEPLANASILDNFPGPVRLTNNNFLDRLLGALVKPRVPIRYGATVAHLSVYVAQHLGCDPIILIGQDLGFSEGLYYCPGTAIHDVWQPELGQFNTVEMMEWQRIARHRSTLHKRTDIHEQPIYTDEQMLTYLKQFERDFAQAPQTIIDATEGGLPIAHTQVMSLADALAVHARHAVDPLPLPERALDGRTVAAAAELLERRLDETAQLRRVSTDTMPILRQMIEHQRDRERMDRLFRKLETKKKRVDALKEIFTLVNELNSIGAYKRARADRAIDHAEAHDAGDRQRQQLERDLVNVDLIVQACDEATAIFRAALQRVEARVQGPESEVQSPESKVQSPRSKVGGAKRGGWAISTGGS